MEFMGILNITPDSFSDGGKYANLETIVARAKEMVAEGASCIDVGGESTRPGAELVTEQEELQRVIPVIKRLAKEVKVPISIDTYKAEVARQAVAAGAAMINDIGGGCFDPKMPEVMAKTGARVILMHNRSVKTLNTGTLTDYHDIVDDVKRELQENIDLVLEAGVSPNKIIIDPGIGFAKTIEGNIELLQRIEELHEMKYPILLGVSRKGTIGHLLGGLDVNNRTEGTVGATCYAISKGVQIVRVHDVLENVRAAKVMEALTPTSSNEVKCVRFD